MKGIRVSYETALARRQAAQAAHEAQLVDGCDPNRLEAMEGVVRRSGVPEADVRSTAVAWVKAGAPLATVRARITAGEVLPG